MPFRRRWQYQQSTIAPTQPPPPTTEDQWHQPWSEPKRYRIAAGLAVALAASGGILPPVQPVGAVGVSTVTGSRIDVNSFQYQSLAFVPTVETITEDKWHQGWLDPVRPRRGVAQQQEIAAPVLVSETITEDKWHQPWSQPVQTKRGLPASQQQFLAFVPTRDVGTIPWYAQLSNPVRIPARLIEARQQALAFVGTSDVGTIPWYSPLATPVIKRRLPESEQQALAFVGQSDVGTIPWHSRLAEPVRVKRNIPAPDAAFVTVTEAITVDKWFRPFGEPVRIKTGLSAANQQSLAFVAPAVAPPIGAAVTSWFTAPSVQQFQYPSFVAPLFAETVTEDKWYQAWSDPVRIKAGLGPWLQQFSPFVPFIETVTVDKWFAPWQDPVRVKLGLTAANQQFLAFVAQPPAAQETFVSWVTGSRSDVVSFQYQSSTAVYVQETVTADKWLPQLSQPRVPSYISIDIGSTIISLESVTEDRWHQPWSEPVRVKAGLAASAQQFLAHVPFVERTDQESKWHEPWPDFARRKTQPHPSQQQFLAFVGPTETVTVDKWFANWREPVRVKLGLAATEQQSLAFQFTPETIFEDKWHQGWSTPVRIKIGLPAAEQQPLAFVFTPETVTEDKWHQQWPTPVRVKLGLNTALQPFAAQPPFVEQTAQESKWHQPWSEPVRKKPIAWAGLQQFFAFAPNPVVSFGWYGRLTEPVRVKQGLSAANQPFQALTFFERILLDKWWEPWREPVRVKLGLRAALQQPLAHVPFVEVTAQEAKWHQPWSEPVRVRPQPTQHIDQPCPREFVAVSITLLLNATEIGDALSANLADVHCFFSNVSVVEVVVPGQTTVSIPDPPAVQTTVSVSEILPIYAIVSVLEKC